MSMILASGVVATLVSVLVTFIIEFYRKKADSKIDLLKIAIFFEGYALECGKKVADNEDAIENGGMVGVYLGKIPDFPNLHFTQSFLRKKKLEIANEVLTFYQLVQQTDQEISFWWNIVGDIDCTRNAASKHTAEIALKSLNLANKIRTTFNLPKRNMTFGKFDLLKFLQEIKDPN